MTPSRWQQLDELFKAALERAPDERAAFLRRTCARDEALLREMESLLCSYEQGGSFMETPAVAAAAHSLLGDEGESLVGQSIGHYRVIRLLGEGGMGQAYLSEDTKLGRHVALKLLPHHLSRSADRLRRFTQEARAASSFNYPNVCAIYEVGETSEGSPYIVMEFVEGVTLRQHLGQKQMALSEALDISIQIASALAAAHDVGVIHRDVKPDNVMLRPDGLVKVLDFGLAKLAEQQPAVDLAMPAQRHVRTEPGMVMGTVNYMSPEQARGLEVDHRTDIWSLGVVLYEMIAGRLPFEGPTNSDVIVSVLEREPPPLCGLVARVPAELQRIASKALTKDRQGRYQTVKELLIDLKDLRYRLEIGGELERPGPATTNIETGVATSRLQVITSRLFRQAPAHSRRVVLAASFVIALMIVGFGLYKLRGAGDFKPVAAAWKIIPLTSFPGVKGDPAFSPDGRQIAFAWMGVSNDNADIYVKVIGEGMPRRLTMDAGRDASPTWSPDGRHVAFIRYSPDGNSLMTVPSLGGAERKLASLTTTAGAYLSTAWSIDGKELAITDSDLPNGPMSIFLISLETGERRRLTTSPPQSGGDFSPHFSPDGRWVAFTRSRSTAVDDIYVVPTAGGEPRLVTRDGRETSTSGLDWTADGREIIFSSRLSHGLFRVPVTGGTPEQLPGIGENSWAPAISRRGDSLTYLYRKLDDNIWRAPGPKAANRDSSPKQLIASTRREGSPRYSPDGKRIAFASSRSGNIEIWTCDAEGGSLAQLTHFEQGQSGSPRWSPDGQQIAFDARPADHSDIYVVAAGGGAPRRLTSERSADIMPVWSADGRWVYFSSDRGGDWQIWRMPVGGGEAVQVTKGGGFGTLAATDEFLYYSRRNALPTDRSDSSKSAWAGAWRIPVAGGEEERVFDEGTIGTMFVTPEGVCFFDPTLSPAPAVKFFNFASRQVTTLVTLDPAKSFAALGSRIAVSPDGQWVLYSQIDQNDYEIMLVENFR